MISPTIRGRDYHDRDRDHRGRDADHLSHGAVTGTLQREGTAMRQLLAGLLAFAGMATASGRTRAAELKPGDAAPPFKLQGSDGQIHDLAQLKGKTVVLAWFPRAFTGG